MTPQDSSGLMVQVPAPKADAGGMVSDMIRGYPRSDDAERGVLSCFLQRPDELLEDASHRVPPEWFYHAGARLLYQELLGFRMQPEPKPLDLVTISQHLLDRGLMDKIGGAATLAELYNFVPTSAHYPYYCGILKDKFWLRSVITACTECINATYEHEEDPRKVLQKAIDALFEVQQAGRGVQRGFLPISSYTVEVVEYIQSAIKSRGHVTHGLATGFTDLDRRLMGIRKKQLIIIAARPAMGKSALAMNIAECIALGAGHYDEFEQVPAVVGVVTAEMSGFDLTLRSVLGHSGINLGKCHTGMISRLEAKGLAETVTRFDAAPLYIFDTPALSIQELHQRVKRAVAQLGLQLLIVDYLQLFKSATRSAASNRQVEVGEVAQGLKAIAKDCDIPVIALAQIGRSAEDRKGCIPQLADLRESGDIEAAADIVGVLYRPGYYERKQERKKHGGGEDDDEEQEDEIADNSAQLIMLKFRNGSTEPIPLTWDGPRTQFGSVTRKLFSNNEAQREGAAAPAPKPQGTWNKKPEARGQRPEEPAPQQPSFDAGSFGDHEDREDYEQ